MPDTTKARLREALECVEFEARCIMQSSGYQEALQENDGCTVWLGTRLHAILDKASAALNLP